MDYIPKVLEQVNQIRQALAIGEGKLPELPKGVPGNSSQCVLARALSNGWKARVEPLDIRLSYDGLEEEGYKKATAALVHLGFDARYYGGNDDDPRELVIYSTTEMRKLVEDFDEELIPELILEDFDS